MRMVKMLARHTKILELITENKKMEVTKLSQLLSVSQVTIRKDLIQLENSGLIVREHGFATLNSSDDINNRLAYHYDIKQRIAKLAVESIEDGETVMIESGSCCALVALEIAQTKKDVTIITNSAFIADYIRKVAKIMVGPITKKCVESFFVDKLFIGTDGFTETSGFTGNDYMRSETVRDMAKQADKVIIVTDSFKFLQKGVVTLIPTAEIACIVTDTHIPIECENYLLDHGIEVKKVEN